MRDEFAPAAAHGSDAAAFSRVRVGDIVVKLTASPPTIHIETRGESVQRLTLDAAAPGMSFMLPPGLGFNAISEKALAAAKSNKMPRSYFDWEEMLKPNAKGFFPYTPATNLLYGLRWQPTTRPTEVNRLSEIPYKSDWNNLAPMMGFAG